MNCECGCGGLAPLAPYTYTARGIKKGDPLRFISGHNSKLPRKHGAARNGGTKTYHIWQTMLARCRRPTNSGYYEYGAKGITVCERWLAFENFLFDMGECPDGLSIDRLDNSQGYLPENCKWRSPKEQTRNKSNNLYITWQGETKLMLGWAESLGIKYHTLYSRIITKGWPIEQALTIEVSSSNGRYNYENRIGNPQPKQRRVRAHA